MPAATQQVTERQEPLFEVGNPAADGSVPVSFEDPDAPAIQNTEEDDEDEDDGAGAGSSGSDEEDEEERPAARNASDEEEHAELANARTDAEREEIRRRRREERKDRREKAREREHRWQAENSALRQSVLELNERLATVANSTLSTQLFNLDQAIGQTSSAAAAAEAEAAAAIARGDGAGAVKANNDTQALRNRVSQLQGVRQQLVQTGAQQPARAAPSGPDPDVQAKAKEWTAQNKWYKPEAMNNRGTAQEDRDSRLVFAIDHSLTLEGFNPLTDAYWEELNRRVKEVLPHRVARKGKSGDTIRNTKKPERTIVGGSGREAAVTHTAGRKTFQLSADRVQALKDAGIWEDPVRRNEMIKEYAAYDRAHPADKR